MALDTNAFQLNEFSIIPLDGNETPVSLIPFIEEDKKNVDLSSSTLTMNYYESILLPNIVIEVFFASILSLVNTIPIRGGEKVYLNISLWNKTLDFTADRPLYVYEVGPRSATGTSEFFALKLITKEALTNERVRCVKKYNNKVDEIVKEILKDSLKTKHFSSSTIHPTANTFSFIAPIKKPFSVLYWLCSKALPVSNSVKTKEVNKQGTAKGVSGFFFYENSEGFNFKSIDDLVSRTNVGTSDLKDIPTYTNTNVIESDTSSNNYKISNSVFKRNIDIMNMIQRGVYFNKTYFYNPYTQKFSTYQYNLKDEIKNANKLGTNDNILVPKEFQKDITRIMFRISDIGVMENDPNSLNFSTGGQRDIADMAKSFSRNSILFSQTLNIVVPCNASLKVGDIIQVMLPKMGTANEDKKMDEEQSGLYLIYKLHHHIEVGKIATSLTLIRDSYGLYGPQNIK